jgi:hypothetical protein
MVAFLLPTAVILISGLINRSNSFLTLLYILLFVFVPLSTFLFVQVSFRSTQINKVLRILLIIGVIQLPIILLQQYFVGEFISHSSRPISQEDVAFGTFFFANDHGLCFFLLSLVIYLLFEPSFHPRWRQPLLLWYSATIVLANSNISIFLLLVILAVYFFIRFTAHNLIPYLLLLAVLVSFVLFVPSLWHLMSEKYDIFQHKIFAKDLSYLEVEKTIDSRIAERFDILVHFMGQNIYFIGEGPYSYFDPIKGEFPKYLNFSQYLWFYNDIGIIGICAVIYLYVSVYLLHHRFRSYKVLYVGLILVYAFFSNTLSDLAFNITFSYFLLIGSKTRLSFNI